MLRCAQLNGVAGAGAQEAHPVGLDLGGDVDGLGPGGSVVVGGDHEQVGAAVLEEAVLGGLLVGEVHTADRPAAEEHVTGAHPGGIIAAEDDAVVGGLACGGEDAAVGLDGEQVTVAVVQHAAPQLVEAGADDGVGLADAAGELVDQADDASAGAVLDQDGVDEAGAQRPGAREAEQGAHLLPGGAAVEAAAHNEVDVVGGVVGDRDALVGAGQDDAAVQGEQGGDPVGLGAVVAGVEQGARGQRGGPGQALDLGVGEGGVVDHGGLRLAEEALAVQVGPHHDARHRRDVGQEGAAGGEGDLVAVDVDLHRAMGRGDHDVVPGPVIPVARGARLDEGLALGRVLTGKHTVGQASRVDVEVESASLAVRGDDGAGLAAAAGAEQRPDGAVGQGAGTAGVAGGELTGRELDQRGGGQGLGHDGAVAERLGPGGQAGDRGDPVGVDAHVGQPDLGEEGRQRRGEALVAVGVEVGAGLIDGQGDRVGAAVIEAQGVLGIEYPPLGTSLVPRFGAVLRKAAGTEDLLAVEAAGAKRQRDPPVGAGERNEGGVGTGGDIEKDRAAPAGGQGGDILLAEAQGRGLGCGEVEEHGEVLCVGSGSPPALNDRQCRARRCATAHPVI